MTTTQQIINQFTTNVDTEKEYTRAELGKILTQVYHEITSDKKVKTEKKPKKAKKEKSDDEEPKKKREPTAYNLFVKEQMPLIKEEFPELSRQDLMREVGRMWNTNKSPKSPKSSKSPKSPKSPKSHKSIKDMINKNYPELDSIQKKRLLDNLLKTSIYWKT